MKTKSILFSAMIAGACVAQGQAPSGQGVQPSGQGGSQTGQTAGQRTSSQQGNQQLQQNRNQPSGITRKNTPNNNSSQAASQTGQAQPGQAQTGQVQPQPGQAQTGAAAGIAPTGPGAIQPTRPGGIGAGADANQRYLLDNQRQNVQPGTRFGGTNNVRFAPTNNQISFGGTNQIDPIANNRPDPIPGGPNSVITDPSGARVNRNGLNPDGTPRAGVNTSTDARTQAQRDDEAFSQNLKTALSQTGATKIYFPQTRSTIMVANQNGTVSLTGNVASDAERKDIEERIRKTQGVVKVQNNLKVSSSGTSTSSDQRLRSP